MPKVWINGQWTDADPDYAPNVFISATAPDNPIIGTVWFDISVSPNVLKIWNGTVWNLTVNVLSTIPSADNDQYILANQVFR